MVIDLYLFFGAALLIGSVLASKISARVGVPVLLVFLAVGMLAGSDGPGGIHFEDVNLAQSLGVVALAIILFSGGLDTEWRRVKTVLGESVILATFGVVATAGLVGVFAHYALGLSWIEGLLLGSIVGSTDAAAVFSTLKARGMSLAGGSDRLLELESGTNDPMAIFLTVGFTTMAASPESAQMSAFVLLFFQQMIIGGVLGLLLGRLGVKIINKTRLSYDGLYSPLLLAWALFSYALPALLGGSGFLSVYLAGIVIGNRPLAHRKSLTSFFDGLAWLMQILMFLALGLLVFPSQLLPIVGAALGLSLFLMLVARPVAVFLSLLGSKRSLQQKVFISWVGLRGAVPIILATYPVVAGVERSDQMFHLIFFVVLTSVLLQGTTLETAANWLGLSTPAEDNGKSVLLFEPTLATDSHLEELSVSPGAPVLNRTLLEIDFPPETLVVLITRGENYVVPTGITVLEAGDKALVITPKEQLDLVKDLFSTSTPGEEAG